jgi:hypothetical protein
MDGGSKHTVVCEDGCKECKNGNVQFLFLFNDSVAGVVCRQDSAGYSALKNKNFRFGEGGQYEYSGNGTKKKNTSA